MLPIQPPFIPAFFSFFASERKLKSTAQNHNEQFYLSWEDALWHLLQIHKIKKDAIILVPEFFCGDVIDNMESHGLKHINYKVDKYLQPNVSDFIQKLQKEKPMLVVIFHAVGITNPLLQNTKKWLQFLPKNSILIEDCVHKVIDPQKIEFITKNHYIIDSLRKVVPLQGSWLYSKQPTSKTTRQTNFLTAWYRFLVFFWWVLMQLFLVAVFYTKNSTIQKQGNKLAEFAMRQGYEVIGDHKLSACGFSGMAWLSRKLNYKKIYENKVEQVQLYKKLLTPLFKQQQTLISKYFFEIPFLDLDYSQLRGFPLGINLEFAESFLQTIRSKNLLLRFELNDGAWSNNQKIVYLPMGLHVKNKDIEWVCRVIVSYNN